MFDHDKIERVVKGMVQEHLEAKFPGREIRINWESPEMSPSEERAFRLLELLADRAGDTGTCFNAVELGNELGFSTAESQRADIWLFKQGYVISGFGSSMSITDPGRDKVETIRMERFKQRANQLVERIAQTQDNQLTVGELMEITTTHMGWVKGELKTMLEHLQKEGLIEQKMENSRTTVKLTPKALANLRPPSHSNPQPQTVINHTGPYIGGNAVGSTIVGRDFHQTHTVNQNNLTELAAFIADLKPRLSELDITTETRQELSDDLTSLELQLKKKEPKPGLIAGIFEGVKDKIQKHATSAIAIGIGMKAEEIWTWLGQHAPKIL
jgi:predicted transcriptional regulator